MHIVGDLTAYDPIKCNLQDMWKQDESDDEQRNRVCLLDNRYPGRKKGKRASNYQSQESHQRKNGNENQSIDDDTENQLRDKDRKVK